MAVREGMVAKVLPLAGVLLVCAGLVAFAAGKYERSDHACRVPDVVLVDQDGERVRLPEVHDHAKPVLVDWISPNSTSAWFCGFFEVR